MVRPKQFLGNAMNRNDFFVHLVQYVDDYAITWLRSRIWMARTGEGDPSDGTPQGRSLHADSLLSTANADDKLRDELARGVRKHDP